MAWDGEEFSRRLTKLSDDTMRMISTVVGTEIQKKVTKMLMEHEDTAVAEKKIQALLRSKV